MEKAPPYDSYGLGWHRDLPDARDYTPESSEVTALLSALPVRSGPLPTHTDLRHDADGVYFSPPQNQGCLNASPAYACVSLIEYFERRVMGHTYEGSAVFAYRMALRLGRGSGNSDVAIRTTLKALRRYGAPPTDMVNPEQSTLHDSLSDISLLGFTDQVGGMVYFRLDSANASGSDTLLRLRACLAAGFPIVFGFPVPRSTTAEALIPFRPAFDSYRGGQAVVAVGYDDQRLPGNQGGILFRSSWGSDWGDGGHGWLPYSFVTHQLAADFWTLIGSRWTGSHELQIPFT